jgi:thymidylate kinase
MVRTFLIGIVGPCAAGKTTLIEELLKQGYDAKQIAQEHSYVQDMWLRITNPDVLIFLDVSFANSLKRKNLNWNEKEFDKQKARLSHAQNHADLYINTDGKTPEQVLSNVLDILKNYR